MFIPSLNSTLEPFECKMIHNYFCLLISTIMSDLLPINMDVFSLPLLWPSKYSITGVIHFFFGLTTSPSPLMFPFSVTLSSSIATDFLSFRGLSTFLQSSLTCSSETRRYLQLQGFFLLLLLRCHFFSSQACVLVKIKWSDLSVGNVKGTFKIQN